MHSQDAPYSLTYIRTYLLTYSLTYLHTHVLTYSLIYSYLAGAPLKQATTAGNAAAANMADGLSLDEALAKAKSALPSIPGGPLSLLSQAHACS